MNGNNILVCGDAMLDIHIYGEVERISPEAPVPVIREKNRNTSLGAAGYVAAQIASAGIGCIFAYKAFYPPNKDNTHNLLDILCQEKAILVRPLYTDKIHSVTTKSRIWTGQQQICRIDNEDVTKPTGNEETKWIETLMEVIRTRNISCVIFSDYDKGTLSDSLIQEIVNVCVDKGIYTILDPKRHTFLNLTGLSIIKPNAREILETHQDAFHCSRKLKDTYLLNTLGANGMALYKNGEHLKSIRSLANHSHVVDVCGCGDITNAMLGVSLAHGLSIEKAMEVANRAAFMAIQHRGCHVLNRKEVFWTLDFDE